MSETNIPPPALLTAVNGLYLKARAFALDLPWKVWRSIQWAAEHTQVWLALAAAFVAGAALSPLARPHLAAYSVPMIAAENVAPPVVNVNLSELQKSLDVIQMQNREAFKLARDTNATVASTKGDVARIQDFADHAPEMLRGMFLLGAAEATPPPKPKPAPTVKKVQTAPVAPTPAQQLPAQPQPMSIPDWIKSKL